jgi:hypothetical protein
MENKNQGIYNNINQFINDNLNINKLYIYAIILICILYILTTNKNTSEQTISLINNENVRIGLLLLIGFIASNNIYVGFIMTLIILTIMQFVTYKNVNDEINIISENIDKDIINTKKVSG